VLFALTLGATMALTLATMAHSKRLAEILDVLSDSRIGMRAKWTAARRAWRSSL
jgi:hypothetical protein